MRVCATKCKFYVCLIWFCNNVKKITEIVTIRYFVSDGNDNEFYFYKVTFPILVERNAIYENIQRGIIYKRRVI